MKRLVLLDSHAILHRAYHALPDFSTSKGEPTGALYGLSTMLLKIFEDLKPDYVIAAYDLAGPTYRHEVFKNYKAGRVKTDEALVQQIIASRKVYEALNVPIYDKEGFEADDILGTIVEKIKDKDIEVIIASGDMDTMQLISDDKVCVYTLKKGIKDTIIYNEKGVIERYGFGPELIPDYKGLRGDPSDNIPGIKGIGEKTATILITTFGTIEKMYKELEAGHEKKFIDAGITPRIAQLLKDNKEEAEFSKALATIHRDVPIDFVLPEKTFKESLDIKKVKALWQELEFRTLGQKLENYIMGKKNVVMSKSSSDDNKTTETANPTQAMAFGSTISKEELERVGLALWLVNSDVTNPQLEDILNFANTDDFEVAKKAIFEEMDRRDVRKIYDTIELPLMAVLSKMEKRGIKIDKDFLKNLSKKYHAELSILEKKIHELAGSEFNINSPKQLSEILFDKLGLVGKNMKKTGGGARSTRESELEKLKDLHPIVPLIFEHRELQKLLSTYIDAIPPLLDNNDRLHTDFISAGSTTGRMASQNPNLQNIPIKSDLGKAIRYGFVAEKGFKLIAIDYSQMELRIAAFLSGDEKLLQIFRDGEDVHRTVAAYMFQVAPEDVTANMRRQAKVINFGILYGMGVVALRQNLDTSREEAQKFLNDYFATFSTLAKYIDQVKADGARKGYTETYFGRRRYFQGLDSKIPYIRAAAERMAFNAPIQGTEADIIKLALIHIDEWITKEKLEDDVFPLLQVHDELVYEVRADKAEAVAGDLVAIMESVIPPEKIKGITLKAESAIGNNWGELK